MNNLCHPENTVSIFMVAVKAQLHTSSIYMDTYHPALSAVTTSLVTSPVDGYLTKYPSSSTVLLRRRVSGMPAMLTYPYGQGRVVVTSLYEDWGYTHWQSTAQGRAIIRDLINWAKDQDRNLVFVLGVLYSHFYPISAL